MEDLVRLYILNITINYNLIFLMLALLIISSFFSMSETVFTSVRPIRLKTKIDDETRGAKKALWIVYNYDRTLTTILVGNNLANIALTTASLRFFITLLNTEGFTADVVSTIVITIIVLIFGEILPKSLAKEHADEISLKISGIFYYIIQLFRPLVWVFLKIKNMIIKEKGIIKISVTGDELETIIDTMEEEGSIDEDEAELLQSVLDLSDRKVYEIMTPRVNMVGIDIEDDTIEDIKKIFFDNLFSRIPVFEETRDNVIGVLHERDFFTKLIKGQKVNIKKLMREPFFVTESMKVDTLIETLQREKIHIAIVSGEYGGTSGIVTMEDALEELVGEIYDEHDEVDDEMIQTIKENKYGINADIDLEDLFEELEIGSEPDSHYSSLGGWLFEMFEDIPDIDESYTYRQEIASKDHDNDEPTVLILKFIVKDIKERRISYVHLTIEEEINE